MREPEVQRDAPAGDDRPRAVVHLAARPRPALKPSWSNARRIVARLRDAAARRSIAPRRRPDSRVPASSCVCVLKNDATSRNAAKPIPSTYGSCAVNTTWYRQLRVEAVLEADLRRIRRAREWLGRRAARPCPVVARFCRLPDPAVVALRRVRRQLSPAPCRASAGLYGTGLLWTISGRESTPLALTMRAMTGP